MKTSIQDMKRIVTNGLVTENPTFRLVLGMCPTLAITTAAVNGLGMGLGFTGAITLLAAIRELIGAGTLFGAQVMPLSYQPMAIVTMTPGGFIVLGFLLAFINWLTRLHERKKKEAQA